MGRSGAEVWCCGVRSDILQDGSGVLLHCVVRIVQAIGERLIVDGLRLIVHRWDLGCLKRELPLALRRSLKTGRPIFSEGGYPSVDFS